MSRHGVPVEQATDPDTEGYWKVDLVRDYADEEVRRAMDKADESEKHAIPHVWLDPDYVPRKRSKRAT